MSEVRVAPSGLQHDPSTSSHRLRRGCTPSPRRSWRQQLPVSERRACAVVGQLRATQRCRRKIRDGEAALTCAIVLDAFAGSTRRYRHAQTGRRG